jgi:protein gp37
MATHSAIEWTDATWNPVTGCTKVSAGCDRCYAATFAERFRGVPGHHFENGFDLTLRRERLGEPLRWKRPRRVFVNSMSDLFHEAVPDEFIAEVWQVMAATPQHTYQVLTKRHARMRAWFRRWPNAELRNLWLGVSVENQKWAEIRIPALLETPAAVRFISAEPLLGPIALSAAVRAMGGERGHGLTASYVHAGGCWRRFHGIDWVIAGGESGHGARPMHPQWARSLRDQCVAAGVPFFFKQWGEWAPTGKLGLGRPLPRHAFIGEPVDEHGFRVEMRRLDKKAAGRLLDGRTWDEMPTEVV